MDDFLTGKFFSCLCTKDKTIFYQYESYSHYDIDKLFDEDSVIPYEREIPYVRVVINPPNSNFSAPLNKWIFEIQQNEIPKWWSINHEKVCWQALETFLKEYAIMGKQLNSISRGRRIVLLYDCSIKTIKNKNIDNIYKCDINLFDNTCVENIYNSTIDLINDCICDEINYCICKKIIFSTITFIRNSFLHTINKSDISSICNNTYVGLIKDSKIGNISDSAYVELAYDSIININSTSNFFKMNNCF